MFASFFQLMPPAKSSQEGIPQLNHLDDDDQPLHESSVWRWAAANIVAGLLHLPLVHSCLTRPRDGGGSDDVEPFLLELEGDHEAFCDGYDLGEKLGEGSFGKVYVCTARKTQTADMPLCVKVVTTKGKKAEREAKLPCNKKLKLLRYIDSLEHPNIVRYRQFIQTSDTLYIIMSRCMGPDLVDHIEAAGDKLLPLHEVSDLSRQMFLALAVVHKNGLMHRDIKPDNFRFKDPAATTLQLLDFGAAKPVGDGPEIHTVTGTLLYAAPEVFDGLYTFSCDLWSAGVVMFLLFAGHLPFETSDVTMLRSLHRDPVLMGDCLFRGERWSKAPRSARELVRGLLTTDPTKRLSAQEALEHSWLRMGYPDGTASTEDTLPRSESVASNLRRCGSSRIALADIRRSYFAWDLAGYDDDSELEDGSPQHIKVEA